MTARARQVAAFFRDVDVSNAKLTRLLGDDLDRSPPAAAPRSDRHTLRIDFAHGAGFMWRCSCHTWGIADTASAARREFGVHADWASRVEASK